ncbi:anaphase-promoting complex subunit 5 [Hydra vulgaris]|uniref:Anaphase-promoting complex subunit 5 n=1 Tax=Hydra vulgaris TaxID=6087 RepID=T2M3X8_HYDVU|nr:anaphase-promoting complex subunit 5 [Hydra vulgaris]
MFEILPYHIPCSIYIRLIVTQTSGKSWESPEVSPEHQRKLLLQALKLIRSTQLSWIQFQQEIQKVMNGDLLAMFLKEVHDLQDIDCLCETIKSLENLFSTDSIMRSSILGLFLRKNILALKKMSFQKISLFFKSLENYLSIDKLHKDICYHSSSHLHTKACYADSENTNFLKDCSSNFSDNDKITFDDSFLISKNKVERFISQQTHFLLSNEIKALSPEKLKDSCTKIQKIYPDISDIHFLNFLNYLRLSETECATKFLQLYFDFKVFEDERKENSEIEKHQMKFKRFRYCALTLGIMHCYYGNYNESLISLEEAVRMAQETNDEKCLQHALFWLKVVEEETNPGKSKFSDIKDCFIENKDEGDAFELKLIKKLGVLHCYKEKVYEGKIFPSILISKVSQILCTMPSMMDVAGLALSAFICFFGFNMVASSLCQFSLLSSKTNVYSQSDENLVLSLCQLANHHFIQGFYSEAKCIIHFASTQITLYNRNQKTIEFCTLQIDFQQCIYERKMDSIKEIIKKLSFIDCFESQYMIAVVNILNGSFMKAFEEINDLLSKFSLKSKLPLLKGKVNLLLVELLMASSSSMALTKLCQLITFSDKYYLTGLKIDAQICLAYWYITKKLYKKANVSLEQMSLQILSNGTCFQKGAFIFLQAQCKLLEDFSTVIESKSQLLDIVSMLDKSLTYFTRANIVAKKRDVLYTLSIVYHHLGYIQDRNYTAKLYRALNEKIKGFTDMICF